MNILLASGGSGGHIAPAIAIAERLPQHRCIFAISSRKVDSVFTRKYSHFSFVKVRANPFKLSPIAFLKFLGSQSMAFFFALRLLKEKKIDLLLAFGGFTSFVFVVAAKLRRIPVIIHESNIIPGKANRLAAPLADKIFLPEGASFRHCLSLRYCSHRKRIQYMGFPIRQEFEAMTKADARAQLGWPPLKKIILIIGGSSGALSLNKWIQQNFIRFAHHNIDIFCIAGPEFSEEKEVTFEDCTLHMLPFCEHMNLLIRACDLVIARGGAGTIGECQFCKKPMILIPHPSDAHSHQLANARQAEQLGIANIIEQSELDHLPSQAIEILSNSPILGAMQRSLEKAFVPDVAERIAGEVEHLLQSKKRKTKK